MSLMSQLRSVGRYDYSFNIRWTLPSLSWNLGRLLVPPSMVKPPYYRTTTQLVRWTWWAVRLLPVSISGPSFNKNCFTTLTKWPKIPSNENAWQELTSLRESISSPPQFVYQTFSLFWAALEPSSLFYFFASQPRNELVIRVDGQPWLMKYNTSNEI